jgi:protein gp37
LWRANEKEGDEMSANTKIEWADATWNPVRGCEKVSEGCRNCYAARMAARFSGEGQPYEGLAEMTPHGPRWTGDVQLVPEVLDQPLKWRKPRRIFVNSMSDLFHEDVPDEFIARVWTIMASCREHTFQILTKRPRRMMEWVNRVKDWEGYKTHNGEPPAAYGGNGIIVGGNEWPLPNVWLGVSVENQKVADERIPLLLQTPAAVRFLSCEPLLGPVDLSSYLGDLYYCDNPRHGQLCPDGILRDGSAILCRYCKRPVDVFKMIDWVIVGGESGPGARPMHPDWVRGIRDQCVAAGVPFFFKQWGEWKLSW